MTVFTGDFNDINYEIYLLIHGGQTVKYYYLYRKLQHPAYKDCAYLGSLMEWESMLHFQRFGYQTFDFGGVTSNPADDPRAISQYKLSFGGEIVPIYLYLAKISALAISLDFGRTIYRRLKNNFKILRGIK
jgi:lipid II:glycine glycyltransferase (peptidoglycan interpeptide bridge formation enzyme)